MSPSGMYYNVHKHIHKPQTECKIKIIVYVKKLSLLRGKQNYDGRRDRLK